MTNQSHLRPAMLAATLFALAGCSDQSRYVMNITSIAPASAPTVAVMNADLVGNFSTPCTVVQDVANISISIEHPGFSGIGPELGAWITGYRIEYLYYDPQTSLLTGPISLLGSSNENLRILAGFHGAGYMSVTINVPVATFALKSWCVGVTRNGIEGYASGTKIGTLFVDRVVARVTVTGEDTTGKTLSADGSLLIYLNDYGTRPSVPGPVPNESNWCYNVDMWSYWRDYGGNQP